MRYLTLVFCLFCLQFTKAQSFIFPKLPNQGTTIATLVPNNWKVIDTAYGDLNNDQMEDLALVLEYHAAVREKRAYGDAETELIQEIQKPRIMVIYFKTATNKYHFALQNNNFILRSEEGGALGEPFKAINIKNNILKLAFEGGNNWRWKLNYDFKYQQKEWVLIQANNTYYNAVSGEMNDKVYDFLAKKIKETTGNIYAQDHSNLVNEGPFNFTQLKTLNTFKKPWTWEITKDNFL